LPFVPFFSAYAAYAVSIRSEIWRNRRTWAFRATSALAALLFVVWCREIFFVDLQKFMQGLS
jgi:hypothetical protein